VVIDAATNMPVASIEVGERPWGLDISRDGRTLFTANGPSNDVTIVDVATRTVTAKVAVGDRPWGVLFVP
jgi:YVTN family beta-propeller protein